MMSCGIYGPLDTSEICVQIGLKINKFKIIDSDCKYRLSCTQCVSMQLDFLYICLAREKVSIIVITQLNEQDLVVA